DLIMIYDARQRDLLDQLSWLPYPKPDGSPDALEIEKEQKALSEAIKAYCEVRSRQMERLIEILKEARPDRVQIAEWFLAVAEARDGIERTLSNALRDIKTPTPRGREFLTVIQMEEMKFYEALARAREAAACRDYIASYRKTLEEKTQALDE